MNALDDDTLRVAAASSCKRKAKSEEQPGDMLTDMLTRTVLSDHGAAQA